MVCRNVSVATLTSLLKSQYSLREVDYYVFKFVADDDDSKWLKLDAASDTDVKLMKRFPQLPQDQQVWYCKRKTVRPIGAGKYYTPKADPDHTRRHRERLGQTRLAPAPRQEGPPPRSIMQYKCKEMVVIRACLLCGDAAWNQEHENCSEHQVQLRKYELAMERWGEACAMVYLHLLDDSLELPSWVRIDNSVTEAGGSISDTSSSANSAREISRLIVAIATGPNTRQNFELMHHPAPDRVPFLTDRTITIAADVVAQRHQRQRH